MGKKRKVKIVERKLMRERAWGTFDESGLIELDERLSESDRLTILCHEGAHLADNGLTEKQVCRIGKILGGLLWNQGYRRVRQ